MGGKTGANLLRYGGAVAVTALAVVLRLSLDPWLGDRVPFLILLAAVVVVAWYGGRGPALVSLIGGALAANFFILPPRHSFAIDRFEYQIGLLLFLVLGGAFVALFESSRRAWRQVQERQLQLEQEIVARQTAEHVLAERETWLQTTLASIGDGVITVDVQGRVTFLNDVAEQLTGWTLHEALGRPVEDIFFILHEETRRPVNNPALQALATNGAVTLANHTVLIARNGIEWPLDDSAAPIRDESGTVAGAVLVFREVAERRDRERQLQQREQQFRTLADSIPQLAWMANPAGYIFWYNRRWYDYTGTTFEQMEGWGWQKVHHPAEVRRVLAKYTDHVASGRAWEDTFPLRRHDGEYRWHLSRAIPIKDGDGEVVQWFGTNTDITDMREAEEQLRTSERHLRAVLDTLAVFVGVLTPDGKLVEANKAALQAAGLAAESVLGKPFEQTYWWSYSGEVQAQLRAAVEQARAGHSARFDAKVRVAEGRLIDIDFMLHPMIDDQGRVTHLIPSASDISERKQFERSLRDSEERYRAIVEYAPVGVCNCAPDGRFVYANRTFCDITGYGLDELTHKTWQELTFADDLSAEVALRRRLLAGEVPSYSTEKRYLRKDGSPVWVSLSASLVRDADGRVQLSVKVIVDISDRKRADEELRATQQRFELAAEAVNGIIYEFDFATGTVHRTRGLHEVLGYHPEEVPPTAQWWWSQIHPEDENRDRLTVEEATSSDRIVREYRLRHKDGRWLNVEDRSVLVRGPDGEPVKLFGCTVDVTERKRAEEALRLQTAKIKRLVESNVIGVTFVDGTRITEANDAFLAMVGFTRADLEAGLLRWPEMTPPEHAPADQRALEELRRQGASTPFQKEYFRKDGSRLPILIGAAVIDPVGPTWVCFVQDMSRIKQVENELREADVRKDEFLATLAHELRNPLAPLRNGLQLIHMAGGSRDAVEQAATMMDRQLTQLVRLVDDLMDVSRISRGKIELRRERLELSTAIHSAIETSRPLIEQMGHELTVALPARPVIVDADLTRLAQVFLNLLNNAAKYTERGGRIWLTAERQGSDVAVSVRDTGIGIAADQLPRLFTMFSQLDHSLERAQGGLGIGLTLVKRLVEMHGGTVEARSGGRGRGAEFIVRLPVVLEESAAQPADSGDEPTPRSALRILVVDDNCDGADSLAMMLGMMGNETRTAYDGEAALAAAAEFLPEVILLDIGLPRLNGYEACRRIRQQPGGKDLVIIAQTGWGQEDDRKRTHEAGFDHHMVKPIDPAALLNLLADLCRPARS